ncbi:MAG: ECF transporter S component [Bacilli bacterium]
MKINLITKISLAALFTAIAIILTRFLSIIDIPAIPFLRVSLAPSFVVFSGMILGPLYGGIVGLLSDVIGFFLFNRGAFAYNYLFSIAPILNGVIAGLLMYIYPRIKTKLNRIPFIQILSFVALNIGITLFFHFNSEFILFGKQYALNFSSRMLIICLSYLLTVLYFSIYSYCFFYKFKGNNDKLVYLNTTSLCILFSLVATQICLNVPIKVFYFQIDPLVILGTQLLSTLIEIGFGTFLIIPLYDIAVKKLNKRI